MSESASPCHLLALPGELKNRIYRLVLVKPKDDPVAITSTGYDRGGGLLQTCKEVRSEALKIFYYENKFSHQMRRFDSNPRVHFSRTINSLGLEWQHIRIRQSFDHEPCWPNLVLWLRRIHASPAATASGYDDLFRAIKVLKVQWHVIAAMFNLVEPLRDLPWSRVEKIILNMRRSLIKEDERWAED